MDTLVSTYIHAIQLMIANWQAVLILMSFVCVITLYLLNPMLVSYREYHLWILFHKTQDVLQGID